MAAALVKMKVTCVASYHRSGTIMRGSRSPEVHGLLRGKEVVSKNDGLVSVKKDPVFKVPSNRAG